MLYRLQCQPLSAIHHSWLHEFEVASDKMAIDFATRLMKTCPFERCILSSESNHLGTFVKKTTVEVTRLEDGRF